VWTYDHTARSLTAEDEESRWLTETELLDAPIPRRHLSAVRPDVSQASAARHPAATGADRVVSDGAPPSAAIPMPSPSTLTPTEALLEELDGLRGTRESVEPDEDGDEETDVFEGFGPARTPRQADVGFGAGAAPSAPAEVTPEPARATAATPAGERKTKRGRASVPSWDEIVFGARQNPTD
jgi:hypothetical protein